MYRNDQTFDNCSFEWDGATAEEAIEYEKESCNGNASQDDVMEILHAMTLEEIEERNEALRIDGLP